MAELTSDATLEPVSSTSGKFCHLCALLDINSIPRVTWPPSKGGYGHHHHLNFRYLQRSAESCQLCALFLSALVPDQEHVYPEQDPIRYHLSFDDHIESGFRLSFFEGDSTLIISRPAMIFRDNSGRVLLKPENTGDSSQLEVRLHLTSKLGKHPVVPDRTIWSRPNFNLIRMWLQSCNWNHETCEPNIGVPLPDRVMDVGSTHIPPRLFESRGVKGRYVALSHCWGGVKPLTTTHRNYEAHLRSIPLASIPATFRDAVIATRNLAFCYLWIDSLCIVQGDRGDWAAQCSKMAEIYSNSALTFAADAANDSYAGFLHPATITSHLRSSFPEPSGTDELMLTENDMVTSIPRLFTRAWAFQEDALSPRMLHFHAQQTSFRCRREHAHDSIWTPERRSLSEMIWGRRPTSLVVSFKQRPLSDDWYGDWIYAVAQYSSKNLTHETDRLPALSGLAQTFCAHLNDRYYAGILGGRVLQQLGWSWSVCVVTEPRSVKRSPSWSWVSCDAAVRWPPFSSTEDFEAKLVNIETQLATANPYGEVVSGRLVLRARVQDFLIDGNERPCGQWNAFNAFRLDRSEQIGICEAENHLPLERHVSCLLLSRHHRPGTLPEEGISNWTGIALEAVSDDGGSTYRRVGVLYNGFLEKLRKTSNFEGVWGGVEERTITIV